MDKMNNQKPVFDLTPLDQLMSQGYIRQIYCYPASGGVVVQTFRDGLVGLLQDVPYLGSGILQTHNPATPLRLSEPYQSVDDLFSWTDLSEAVTYDSLRAVNFSPRSLTRKDIEPELPEGTSQPMPLLRVKLTLLKGGCLLYICLNHCGNDITGCGTMMRLWAAHCRGESTEALGFNPAWLDRTPLLNLSPRAPQPPPERPPARASKNASLVDGGTNIEREEFETAVFRFPSEPLKDLKAKVNAYVPSIGVPWVSTSDILIALLWSAATGAEAQASTKEAEISPKPTVTIAMPVNVRHRLKPPLPKEYLGAAYSTAAATALRNDLLSAAKDGNIRSLAATAAAVRASYGEVSHESVSKIAGLIQACPDLSKVRWAPPYDGVVIVSWADQGINELDWGPVIGKCDAVRFQEFGYRAYPYILPRLASKSSGDEGGDFEFILSLEVKAMKLFREGFIMSKVAGVGTSS